MSYLRASALFMMFFMSLPAFAGVAEQDTSVIGTWRLIKILDSSEITALDDAQANALLGHLFVIQSGKVQLNDRTCKAPNFEVTRAETNDYFARQAHISADRLGLPNPVTAVHLNCTYVYKKAPGRLVVHWKGYFFDAIRQR